MHYDIDKIMREERDAIEFQLRIIEKMEEMQDSTEETLEIKQGKMETVYYCRYVVVDQNGEKRRPSERIGDEREPKVIEIKQKHYNAELKKKLVEAKAFLDENIGKYKGYDIDMVDKALPEVYRDHTGLVNKDPFLMSAKEWSRKPYVRNAFPYGTGKNVASDGTQVRSKGEIIIYDQLLFVGIPFRSDAEVRLKDRSGMVIEKDADFLFYAMEERNPVLEQLGMLSDDGYFTNTMKKLKLYIENGYTLNVDLFLTADDCEGKTNAYASMQVIKNLILPRVQLKK